MIEKGNKLFSFIVVVIILQNISTLQHILWHVKRYIPDMFIH